MCREVPAKLIDPNNTQAMPKAWLARFGRTVASQAVDAIGARMQGGGATHVTLGGQALSLSGAPGAPEEDGADALDRLARSEEPGGETRTMTGHEVLLASSFQLSAGGEAGAPAWTAWEQFATGGFNAEVDGTRMDGRVTPTQPLRSISPCARVTTTQPMRCATPEAHDDVDRRRDRNRESAAVASSEVRQRQGTRLHGRT